MPEESHDYFPAKPDAAGNIPALACKNGFRLLTEKRFQLTFAVKLLSP
jgi:hypothetical protein